MPIAQIIFMPVPLFNTSTAAGDSYHTSAATTAGIKHKKESSHFV